MLSFRDTSVKLTTVLMICLVILNVLVVESAEASNKITTKGEIRIYDENRESELTSYNFPLFTGGKSSIHSNWFFVKNTGKQKLEVHWSITRSSIPWNIKAKHSFNGYEHYEEGISKYFLSIHTASKKQNNPNYIAPEKGTIRLDGGEETKLCLELTYTGKPNTAEKFKLTITFTAINTKQN
jgi:hypothetical protein